MSAMAVRLRDAGYIVPRARDLTVGALVRELQRRGHDPDVTVIKVSTELVAEDGDGWGIWQGDHGVPSVEFYLEDDEPGWDQLTAALGGAA
jgi:hypothetical protein